MVDARDDRRIVVREGSYELELAGAAVMVTAPHDVTVADWAPLVELAARQAGKDPAKVA